MGDAIHAIVLVGLELPDTMPMDRGTKIINQIGDVHYHLISLLKVRLVAMYEVQDLYQDLPNTLADSVQGMYC